MRKDKKEAIKEIAMSIFKIALAILIVLISYFVYKLIVGDADLKNIPIMEYTISDIGRIFLVGVIIIVDLFFIKDLFEQ